MHRSLTLLLTFAFLLAQPLFAADAPKKKYNFLYIISNDLTYTALSCYGNEVCKTPNIDRLASQGVRFTRAYCQGTYCGPSRASFMSGYYPHAIELLNYVSPRPKIGDRATWAQHFKHNGYYSGWLYRHMPSEIWAVSGRCSPPFCKPLRTASSHFSYSPRFR